MNKQLNNLFSKKGESNMNNELITISTLCEEIGIGKTTAYKLIKSGVIPAGKIGRKIVIHRSELEKYIHSITHTIIE